jgi:hypothetical protein
MLMFSDAETAGYDPTAGMYLQGYEAAVNTRGLVFIESDARAIGMVCVIPIGIKEISSVTIEVKPGDHGQKGDELGYFSYGGSTSPRLPARRHRPLHGEGAEQGNESRRRPADQSERAHRDREVTEVAG